MASSSNNRSPRPRRRRLRKGPKGTGNLPVMQVANRLPQQHRPAPGRVALTPRTTQWMKATRMKQGKPNADTAVLTSKGMGTNDSTLRTAPERSPRYHPDDLKFANQHFDEILVLLGKIVQKDEMRKKQCVLGSPRACQQEFTRLLQSSKNALVHKYKREGLYFLEQGFHGHAIQSFKRAILLKKQPTSKTKGSNSYQSHLLKSAEPQRISRGSYSRCVSPWIIPTNAGSTSLSMDLGERLIAGRRAPHKFIIPQKVLGARQCQIYKSSPDSASLQPRRPELAQKPSQRKHRQRHRESRFLRRKRTNLSPSFFSALSPRHPRKTTALRDPRRDPRRDAIGHR